MIVCINGGVPRPEMEAELEPILDEIYASLADAPGFISSHDCVTEDGEEINILRFETDEDLIRWRDTGVHGSYRDQIDRYYLSFWVQTAEVHREYVWRDGGRVPDDLVTFFRKSTD